MKVSVRVFWHVIIEGNIDSLNVHPSSKQVGGHQDSPLEVLELLVARQVKLSLCVTYPHIESFIMCVLGC